MSRPMTVTELRERLEQLELRGLGERDVNVAGMDFYPEQFVATGVSPNGPDAVVLDIESRPFWQ